MMFAVFLKDLFGLICVLKRINYSVKWEKNDVVERG